MKSILAVDVGTSNMRAVVGRAGKDGPRILGAAEVPSLGIDKGLVVDVEEAARSLAAAVSEALRGTGAAFDSAHLGISGGKVSSLSACGKIVIISADKVVTAGDCRAAVEEAIRKAGLPYDCEPVQAIPISFKVDDSSISKNPVGLTADSLEANVHLVAVPSNAVANFEEMARRAGLGPVEFAFKPLASTRGILEDGDHPNCAVIDVGSGTSGMAILVDGIAVESCTFPLGGINITRDLSLGLKIPFAEAEEVKREFGMAVGSSADELDFISLGSTGDGKDRVISKRYVCQIIEARLEEIFKLASSIIRSSKGAGAAPTEVLLTGGSSNIPGIEELASRVFGLPARTRRPRAIDGIDRLGPEFACAVGTLLLAVESADRARGGSIPPPTATAELVSKVKESLVRFMPLSIRGRGPRKAENGDA